MKYHISYDIEFKRNKSKGLYVAFEGIDGSGKSTQVAIQAEYLKSKNKKVVTTSEPRREGPVGALIHEILQRKVKVPSVALQYLYTADRIINHKEVVEPALAEGETVLSHRCLWSNLPYGMLDKHATAYGSNDTTVIDVAHGLMSLYHQFTIPDITFYFRVSPDTAIERLTKQKGDASHLEKYEKIEKLKKVAEGYEWQLKQFPKEFIVVDAEKSEKEVSEEIQKVINERLRI